jgi:RNA polymerase sigma factor (sigma-70 family)
MAAPAFAIQSQNANRLADPALREGLLKYARRRLPPGEVEDLVQNTLTEALVSANAPNDHTDFRRWVHGIARHKIADSYRRRGRLPVPSSDIDQRPAEPSPAISELSQWIASELPKTDGAEATLHWLLREGDGESLDEIARDLDLPAPRVRQRVSRLRRHLHARWLALGAAGLVLLVSAGALLHRASGPTGDAPSIAREQLSPLERARVLRQNALQRCAVGAYEECVAELDRAQILDPSGESASAIRDARAAAAHPERPIANPSPPESSAPNSMPDAQSTPKQKAPRKVFPKPISPGKLEPKQLAPGKAEPRNVLPSQRALPPDGDLTGNRVPFEQRKNEKL